MPRSKNAAPALELKSGAFYWIAIDDGASFTPIRGLPEGPHLVRLDQIDGEWRAVMLGRQGGLLEIEADIQRRIVRGSWERRSMLGSPAFDAQEVRITWLAEISPPPAIPSEIESG